MADYIPDWTEDEITRKKLDSIRGCVSCGRYGILDEWGECEDCVVLEEEDIDDRAS